MAFDPVAGSWLLSPEELAACLDEEVRRADEQRRQAEEQRRRAEAAEAELARLRAELDVRPPGA